MGNNRIKKITEEDLKKMAKDTVAAVQIKVKQAHKFVKGNPKQTAVGVGVIVGAIAGGLTAWLLKGKEKVKRVVKQKRDKHGKFL